MWFDLKRHPQPSFKLQTKVSFSTVALTYRKNKEIKDNLEEDEKVKGEGMKRRKK